MFRRIHDGIPQYANLDGFARRKGRLLIIHGLADPYFSPHDIQRYLGQVVQRYGAGLVRGPRQPAERSPAGHLVEDAHAAGLRLAYYVGGDPGVAASFECR